MRWLLVLALAACSTSRTGDMGSAEERSELLRRLRGAEGYANLVADGRFYIVEPDALQSEIREFAVALAYAIETQPDTDRGESPATGSEAVIAQPWLDRGLCVNQVSVTALRTPRGTFYWTWVELEGQTGHSIEVTRGTAAVDAAWERLAHAARAEAAYTDVFGPVGAQELRGERGIDVRGSSIEHGPSMSPRAR